MAKFPQSLLVAIFCFALISEDERSGNLMRFKPL
ncbi:hypothetical protein CASFOL_028271 [Castilleja foliolosa]|uniref:Uncharacterized protein n=1 Tax=Castilleja foliolosa TaxID=1961234 RepID=A0ABD3CEU4_9LAMI